LSNRSSKRFQSRAASAVSPKQRSTSVLISQTSLTLIEAAVAPKAAAAADEKNGIERLWLAISGQCAQLTQATLWRHRRVSNQHSLRHARKAGEEFLAVMPAAPRWRGASTRSKGTIDCADRADRLYGFARSRDEQFELLVEKGTYLYRKECTDSTLTPGRQAESPTHGCHQ
jgi:hypothetical protein